MVANKYKPNNYHLTTEDERQLVDMYYRNIKFDEMYRITKIPSRKIQSFFKERNMDLVKRYNIDDNYFRKINTPKKAYWLGYFYCDGFVGSGKYNNIVLSSIDKEIIQSFADEIVIDGLEFIYKKHDCNGQRKHNSYGVNDLHELRFSSKTMKKDLYKYNIFTNRKSEKFLNYKEIEKGLWKYIVFGMLDADGYIGIKSTSYSNVNIYVPNKLIDDYLELFQVFKMPYSLSYNKNKNAYYYNIKASSKNTRSFLKSYSEFSPMTRKASSVASWLANS